MNTERRYLAPSSVAKTFSRAIATLAGHGVSLFGSRVLVVRGRTTGQPRETAVNLLEREGSRYLVAARGEAQWVRNLRAAGNGELRLGRKVERFTPTELADTPEKVSVLRSYVRRWKFEVGAFFPEVTAATSEQRWLELAPGYPVFRVEDTPASR